MPTKKTVIVRTPLRLEFLGGATDIASFYRKYPGHILNTTIDKYAHITVRSFSKGIRLLYEKEERVKHARALKHARTREALKYFGIITGVEVISRSDVGYHGSGLGSSSSYTVGLVQAIAEYSGKRMSTREIAETAAHIEIDVLKEPIGKQDQYAAAFGGLAVSTYARTGSVSVRKVNVSKKVRNALQAHLLVFSVGTGHSASKILKAQGKKAKENFKFLKKMSDIVSPATKALTRGDLKRFAEYLYEEWTIKKNLSSGITTPRIEKMYASAVRAGAWGGRVSGAGGGGYLYVLAPRAKHKKIRRALSAYREFPITLTKEGSRVIFKN